MMALPYRKICAATLIVVILLLQIYGFVNSPWSVERANAWYKEQPWMVGSNYLPRTAINTLEMWQAETFDLVTIDEELGWAEELGFNSMRVFLHPLLWEQDSEGFLKRIDQFLAIADRHNIGVIFVLLDGVWNPFPKLGKQPAPRPHVHNSGWVQAPGVDMFWGGKRRDNIEYYIKGVISRFRNDRRVKVWDLYNEPDNANWIRYHKKEPRSKPTLVLKLLTNAFTWARSVSPSQPLTVGIWYGDWSDIDHMSLINQLLLEQSDILSFHNYLLPQLMRRDVQNLKKYGRPILCTEYMARTAGSTFDPIMADLKEQKVGAYNWGFVSGKSQTIYPWDSWKYLYTGEPEVWFHDILHPDGTPYSLKEADYIRKITGVKKWVFMDKRAPVYSFGPWRNTYAPWIPAWLHDIMGDYRL